MADVISEAKNCLILTLFPSRESSGDGATLANGPSGPFGGGSNAVSNCGPTAAPCVGPTTILGVGPIGNGSPPTRGIGPPPLVDAGRVIYGDIGIYMGLCSGVVFSGLNCVMNNGIDGNGRR
ncbi:hypothetical protein GOP47_0012113 [Adiantum capillus-veneris]|uniref:Uncharacterized protein n=1 Tax=Adiantum capillus-veneris TaxID=13818 RepID=A0A9D4ZFD3_ADICA|nr:hypothetical protein GOP47_0012113 [Adiantum capillus-veneris]